MTDIKKKKKKIFRCESHKAAVVEPMQLIGLCKELISARAQVSRFHGRGFRWMENILNGSQFTNGLE